MPRSTPPRAVHGDPARLHTSPRLALDDPRDPAPYTLCAPYTGSARMLRLRPYTTRRARPHTQAPYTQTRVMLRPARYERIGTVKPVVRRPRTVPVDRCVFRFSASHLRRTHTDGPAAIDSNPLFKKPLHSTFPLIVLREGCWQRISPHRDLKLPTQLS